MTRRVRPPSRPLIAIEEQKPVGLSFADVFAPLSACFTTLVDVVTGDTMQTVIEHFQSIKFCVGHQDLNALRRAIRVVVAEKALELLKEQIAGDADEPATLTRIRMCTTHEMLIEFLTEYSTYHITKAPQCRT